MRIPKSLVLIITLLLSVLSTWAQDVVVTVTPTSPILPPQVLNYIDNPGKYFNVTLTNTSGVDQEVFLGLEITHTMPNDGLTIATPNTYQPSRPIVVPAGVNPTYQLTTVDMKNLFNHIPQEAMQVPDGLVDGYNNGSFGLLSEGLYQVHFIAYHWQNPKLPTAVPVSNPIGGTGSFRVCYMAPAPVITFPSMALGGDTQTARMSTKNPILAWTPTIQSCNASQQFEYSVKIVEIDPSNAHLTPDAALEQNSNVRYFKNHLPSEFITIPEEKLRSDFQTGKTYVAQVTASVKVPSLFNYTTITNNGKSAPCRFTLVDEAIDIPMGDQDDEEEAQKRDINVTLEMLGMGVDIDPTKDYTFRCPEITQPAFRDYEVRKSYIGSDIDVEWSPAWYLGGEGENPFDLTMEYTVNLYNGGNTANMEEAMKTDPIYTAKTDNLEQIIPWDDIADHVKQNDYLVLQIKPTCTNSESVAFVQDSLSVVDFAMLKYVSKEFFECSNSVTVENTKPTTKSKESYLNHVVAIGEYDLTIDKITAGDAESGFTGTGRVKWELGIGTAMVHVKFDKLKINTDDIVYEGECESVPDPAKGAGYDAVSNIFSDLGIEDLLAKTDVPYAKAITNGLKTKAEASDVAQTIGNYYSLVQSSMSVLDMLGGKPVDVYMPLCMPSEKLSSLNSSPVDIQVTTMKFAPTWATMDLLGQFTLPESECLDTDVLLFGAPRLCISPDHIIPESGQLALLGNFTVQDPRSGYQCTFKAPKDLLKPQDGCYISWKDYKFEVLGVDVDMKIPKLKKYDLAKGQLTEELPTLTFTAMFSDWDDFCIDNITMEAFEADQLPGFTFQCKNMALDHSIYRNTSPMASFKWPKGFNQREAVGDDTFREHGIDGWMGVYVGHMDILLPEGIQGSEGRLQISGTDMLFDNSGVTLNADVQNLISATVGEFTFDIERIGLSILQNNFDNCHIDGSLTVPLLKTEDKEAAKIGLYCQIRKQIDAYGHKGDKFAYVFNTKSLNGDYVMDVFLAKLKLNEKLTYLLVESEPDAQGQMQTKCELELGGTLAIGGKATIEKWAKNSIGYKLSLPDIHFVGMRLANCERWKSKYVDIQADIDAERKSQKGSALAGLYTDGTDAEKQKLSKNLYFDHGSWSLASKAKQLGPFEFSIEDYNIHHEMDGSNLTLSLDVTGKVALVKGIDLSGTVGLSIAGQLTDVGIDLSKIGTKFGGVKLKEIGVNTSFCGMKIEGDVKFYEKGEYQAIGGDKGFAASLDIALPGDLFKVHGDGGYFDSNPEEESEDSYSWGWVHLDTDAKIQLGPCMITRLGGGFYMNCQRKNGLGNVNDMQIPTKRAGLVGIIMDLGMASPDGATVKGDLSLNVVYNRKRKCLSNFTMTGNVKAVGDMINSKMTLVYENSPSDRYLQLNMTVDASLEAESMAGALDDFGAGLGSIKEQMKALAGDKYQELLAGCKQGLSSKIGAKAESRQETDPEEQPSNPAAEENADAVAQAAKTTKGENKGSLPKMGATVSLDVKITWRAAGKSYITPKWHIYLGKPSRDERCTLTLIDYGKESDPVYCNIGANMYLCVGNELPDNGELPPIPEKISNFLDGSQRGDFKSDNISQANAARQQALAGFNGELSGGVMLGAEAYGKMGIDLGLIYGKLETILGFDVSLVHYKNGYCVNLGQVPGYRGWYGKGQLYAYLYMMLGMRFDLGFVDYDLRIADAEVGGVLKMGGPSPNYFQGKARAKISLLSGLFKFDKSFTFDVGEYCQLFKGNALDDFELFDDCSLGDTIRTVGWPKQKAGTQSISNDQQTLVKANITTPQYINTIAPLDEHFRMLDENELERIASNFGEGSDEWEKAKNNAKRTFVFHKQYYAWLYEYNDTSRCRPTVEPGRTYDMLVSAAQDMMGAAKRYNIPFVKGGSRSRHYLDLGTLRKNLKPGKYYRLRICGEAWEIMGGEEVAPWTSTNGGKSFAHKPWVKHKDYYFMTAPEVLVNDKAPLQDYVAIAYPSNFNQLKSNENDVDAVSKMVNYTKCYLSDVQAPTIALTEDIRDRAFRKGKLYWRLLTPMGKQLDIVENKWVESTVSKVRMLNMEPERRLKAEAGQKYILALDYYANGQRLVASEEDRGQNLYERTLEDTTLVYLYVEALPADRNWRVGTGNGNRSCDYDQPFIAQKLTSVSVDNPTLKNGVAKTDLQIRDDNSYTSSPISFVGYMSNFVFPAGWEVTERNFFGIEVTTSESMIFTDPAGGGKFEGVYRENETTRTSKAFNDIKNTFIYTIPTTTSMGYYNYPVQYPLSAYWHKGAYASWDYVHDVDDRIPCMNVATASDGLLRTKPLFKTISDVYTKTSSMSTWINAYATYLEENAHRYDCKTVSRKDQAQSLQRMKGFMKDWCQNHLGQYLTEGGFKDGITDGYVFHLPSYQLPVAWSVTSAEKMSGAYKGMNNSNDRASEAGKTWSKMTGMSYFKYADYGYNTIAGQTKQTMNLGSMKETFRQATAVAYRVNAYDMEGGHYWVSKSLLNGPGEMTMTISQPIGANPRCSSVTMGQYNSNNSSVGTTTGQAAQGVDKNTTPSPITYAQLEEACREVVAIRDSAKLAYNFQQKYWPRYKSRIGKMETAADKAEGNAQQAALRYSKGITQPAEKTRATQYIEETRQWNDSIATCLSFLYPKARVRYTKRSLQDLNNAMNAIMDNVVTPASDQAAPQYKKYKAMQDEVNTWHSDINREYETVRDSYTSSSVWNGSTYVMGDAKGYMQQTKRAQAILDKLRLENLQQVRTIYSSIAKTTEDANLRMRSCRSYNQSVGTYLGIIRRNAANATDPAQWTTEKKTTQCIEQMNTMQNSFSSVLTCLERIVPLTAPFATDINAIGGQDGKSGKLAQLETLLSAYSSQYIAAREDYDNVVAYDKTTREDSAAAFQKWEEAKRIISPDTLAKRLQQAYLRMEEFSGKDIASAQKNLDRLDAIIAEMKGKKAPYETEELRRAYYADLMVLRQQIINRRSDYLEGDIAQLQPCVDDCKQFLASLDRYAQYTTTMNDLLTSMPTMADSVWNGLREAGYSDEDKRVTEAKARWTEALDIATFKDWCGEVNTQYEAMRAVGQDGAESISAIKTEAEAYISTPGPLHLKASERALGLLRSMNSVVEADKKSSTGLLHEASHCRQVVLTKQESFGVQVKRAKAQYDIYDANLQAMVSDIDPEEPYLAPLRQCITYCNGANSNALKASSDLSSATCFEAAQDSLSAVATLMGTIRRTQSDPRGATLLSTAQTLQGNINAHYNKIVAYKSDLTRLATGTLPERDRTERAPLQQKAQEALDYIEANGRPYRSPEMMSRYYMKQIAELQEEIQNILSSCNELHTTTTSDLRTAQSDLAACNAVWKRWQTQRASAQSFATKLTSLEGIIKSFATDCDNIPSLDSRQSRSIILANQSIGLLSEAKEYMDYIQRNASHNTQEYLQTSSRITQMTATNETIAQHKASIASAISSVNECRNQLSTLHLRAKNDKDALCEERVSECYLTMQRYQARAEELQTSVRPLEPTVANLTALNDAYSQLNTDWLKYSRFSRTWSTADKRAKLNTIISECNTVINKSIPMISNLNYIASASTQASDYVDACIPLMTDIRAYAAPRSQAALNYTRIYVRLTQIKESISTTYKNLQPTQNSIATKKRTASEFKLSAQEKLRGL